MLPIVRPSWMALGVSVLLCSAAISRTIRVPQDIPTIQAGLDDLEDQDTVLISLGTYTESLVAPSLHFVLKGDVLPDTGDYARPIIDPTLLPGSDTLNCLTLPLGSHPVIEDLMFQNGAAMYPHVYADGGISCHSVDPVLRRVVMDSVVWALIQWVDVDSAVITLDSCDFRHIFDRGVYTPNAVVATNCRFTQNGATLIQCSRHSRILQCRFDSDHILPDEAALAVAYGDVQVEANVFHGGVVVWWPRQGMTISDNIFEGISGYYRPLWIRYDAPQSEPSLVSVSDNVFVDSHADPEALSSAIEFEIYPWFDAVRLATISGNTFTLCQAPQYPSAASAIRLCDAAEIVENHFFHLTPDTYPSVRLAYVSPLDTTVHLRDNLFYDTGLALENDVDLTMDARFNWWGDSSGPYHQTLNPFGRGDTVLGDVSFAPWYPDTSFLLPVPGLGKPLPQEFVFEAYPNPFNSTLRLTLIPSQAQIIQLELFDLLGRRVAEVWKGPLAFQKELSYDASNLASGLYFAQVTDVIDKKTLAMRKLMLLK